MPISRCSPAWMPAPRPCRRTRMRVAAENLANAGSTRKLEDGLPYARQRCFPRGAGPARPGYRQGRRPGGRQPGLRRALRRPSRRDPNTGMVKSDIDPILELTDLMLASRAIEFQRDQGLRACMNPPSSWENVDHADTSRSHASVPGHPERAAQTGAQPARAPRPPVEDGKTFDQVLTDFVQRVDGAQRDFDQAIQAVERGESDDLHQVMIAQNQAQLSLKLAAEVRNKLVEAYKEAMRTQF